MVDSDRGITNLHVPSDVIIDASMPAAIRSSGQMWNARGELEDTLFVIPDHSYAPLYAETVEHCRRHGAFDPSSMGTTPNVGLMAQAAEEYGSHDKTFELDADGRVRVLDDHDRVLMEHEVQRGRHLADVPNHGRRRPGLGGARADAGEGDGLAGRVLARRDAAARPRAAGKGAPGDGFARDRRRADRGHGRGAARPGSPSSELAVARTRSR